MPPPTRSGRVSSLYLPCCALVQLSKLGVALRYFTNHQIALARFLGYGYQPLDNGIVERLHVRTALTRNYAESRIMRSNRGNWGQAAGPRSVRAA